MRAFFDESLLVPLLDVVSDLKNIWKKCLAIFLMIFIVIYFRVDSSVLPLVEVAFTVDGVTVRLDELRVVGDDIVLLGTESFSAVVNEGRLEKKIHEFSISLNHNQLLVNLPIAVTRFIFL